MMTPLKRAWCAGYATAMDEAGNEPQPVDPLLAAAWQAGFDAAEEEKERERQHVPTQKELNEHAANEAALNQE